jgi:hypothetical protein
MLNVVLIKTWLTNIIIENFPELFVSLNIVAVYGPDPINIINIPIQKITCGSTFKT